MADFERPKNVASSEQTVPSAEPIRHEVCARANHENAGRLSASRLAHEVTGQKTEPVMHAMGPGGFKFNAREFRREFSPETKGSWRHKYNAAEGGMAFMLAIMVRFGELGAFWKASATAAVAFSQSPLLFLAFPFLMGFAASRLLSSVMAGDKLGIAAALCCMVAGLFTSMSGLFLFLGAMSLSVPIVLISTMLMLGLVTGWVTRHKE